jgi:hypothetical protein
VGRWRGSNAEGRPSRQQRRGVTATSQWQAARGVYHDGTTTLADRWARSLFELTGQALVGGPARF